MPKNIAVTETKAYVQLDDLMKSTTSSLVESNSQSIIKTIEHENLQYSKELNATLTCKWGIDGAGGHGSELVITSLCALTLSIKMAPGEFIVWENQSPGSPH